MQKNKPKIIAFANQKGGVGKTTTTLNLAAAFCERDRKVLILDLVMEEPLLLIMVHGTTMKLLH